MENLEIATLELLLSKCGISLDDLKEKPKRKQPSGKKLHVKPTVEKVESYHLELHCTCLLCKMTWVEKWFMEKVKVKDEYGLISHKIHRIPRDPLNFRKGRMKRLTCHCCERRLMRFATKQGLVRGLILERRKVGG
jgi:hypothetical protein